MSGPSLFVSAQSQSLGADTSVPASGEDGVAVVPHGKLVALLQGASEDALLELDGSLLNIKLGRSKANVPCENAGDFITPPEMQCKSLVVVGGKELSEALATAVAAAGDSTQQAWHEGIMMLANADGLMLCSADGKQFSSVFIPECGSDDFKLVVPAREMKRLNSTVHGSESVSLMFSDNGLCVTCDDATFRVQALALAYPDVKKVADHFDTECTQSILLNRDEFLTSLRQASVLLNAIEFNVKISPTPEGLSVTSVAASNGGYSDVVSGDCSQVKDSPEIGINHKMMASHLQTLKCESVRLHYAPESFVVKITPEGVIGRSYYTSTIKK
jgi:DNA polymerase III sliding clamp (beta) subunit (PCNA family)